MSAATSPGTGLANATAALWLRNFFENPLVNRVNRRCCMRSVRLLRSTYDVETRRGRPLTTMRCTPTTWGGE